MDFSNLKLTPTQRRMLDILKDGAIHSKEELHSCLGDELQPLNNVRMHINTMRGMLQLSGNDVLWQGKAGYRLVAHINSINLISNLNASPIAN